MTPGPAPVPDATRRRAPGVPSAAPEAGALPADALRADALRADALPADALPTESGRPGRRTRAVLLVGATLAVALVLAAVDLTLGTSTHTPLDLLRAATGEGDPMALAVLLASRLPRVLAAVCVGAALGAAGVLLQSVARNPLASPDTLGVSAGGYLAVVMVAVLGWALPLPVQGLVAFVGGLAAAAVVLALSRAGRDGPTRLVLAGSAITLALGSATTVLLVLFAQETTGLFAWGAGNVAQSGTTTVLRVLPVVALLVLAATALGRRLDLLGLGDDAAAVLGVDVRRTRVVAVVVAVLLSAAAVTVAGPVGFVGLGAPVLARMLARRSPSVSRHAALVPFAALVGCTVVLGADVLLRALLPASTRVTVPTGVVTTVLGAALLVVLAQRLRDDVARGGAPTGSGYPRSRRRVLVTLVALTVAAAGATVAALLLGDRLLLTGDVLNWWRDAAGPQVSFVLDQRAPRVVAALVAGGALGLAGTLVQAVVRNPLAEPGLLGVTGGAGVGAVLVIVLLPSAGVWTVSLAAAVGALAVFALLLGLAGTGGGSDRIVLMGVGVSAASAGLITLIVVVSSPWSTTLALTWLSGSTYGRSLAQSVPVAVVLAVALPIVITRRRQLDLLALDDDVPRVLGVAVDGERRAHLAIAAALTAAAVSAVGIVGFVGLVAAHLARGLVGAAHRWAVPTATLVGALLVSVSDTLGRTVIAPGQLPAGLVTALVGAPYFVWLLWRTRRAAG